MCAPVYVDDGDGMSRLTQLPDRDTDDGTGERCMVLAPRRAGPSAAASAALAGLRRRCRLLSGAGMAPSPLPRRLGLGTDLVVDASGGGIESSMEDVAALEVGPLRDVSTANVLGVSGVNGTSNKQLALVVSLVSGVVFVDVSDVVSLF